MGGYVGARWWEVGCAYVCVGVVAPRSPPPFWLLCSALAPRDYMICPVHTHTHHPRMHLPVPLLLPSHPLQVVIALADAHTRGEEIRLEGSRPPSPDASAGGDPTAPDSSGAGARPRPRRRRSLFPHLGTDQSSLVGEGEEGVCRAVDAAVHLLVVLALVGCLPSPPPPPRILRNMRLPP
jgi:hypothetical protein